MLINAFYSVTESLKHMFASICAKMLLLGISVFDTEGNKMFKNSFAGTFLLFYYGREHWICFYSTDPMP